MRRYTVTGWLPTPTFQNPNETAAVVEFEVWQIDEEAALSTGIAMAKAGGIDVTVIEDWSVALG